MAISRNWILVTGQPGCGKTTAVQRMAAALQEAGVTVKGFTTDEVRPQPGSSRIGFDVVTIPDGQRGPLARKGGKGDGPKTGPYTVDVPSLERLALPTLEFDPNIQVYVLDEIGRMELHSVKFKQHVQALLARDNVRLVGAITAPRYGHRVEFCDHVAATPGVTVHNLTKANREQVVQRLLEQLEQEWLPRI
eukprot:scaffold1803_cov92-Amphora_coffeaeformis.AAC.3